MNIFADVSHRISTAIADLQSEGKLPADLPMKGLDVDLPRDPTHGDLASNAAMVLAKPARMKPRDIAELLKTRLADDPQIARIEIAGPGFLNITLVQSAWQQIVTAVLREGSGFGKTDVGQGRSVNIEYVSANPTGPMHIGHCRGAVFGDTLANLLAYVGYKVTREYYINDAGGQVEKLGASTMLRYREALGETVGEIPAGLYPGEYLIPIGAELARVHGRALLDIPEEEAREIARDAAISSILAEIKVDLAALAVHHDVFFSERSLATRQRDRVKDAIDRLQATGRIYRGRLERPKGHDADDWEDREQTLFRSTDYGDDSDRALLKSDGGYTYFAGDVAYHYDKILRGFDEYINVFGADHVGYIPRIKAAMTALSGNDPKPFEILVCQLVRVLRAGEPVRMSKRAGTFVALRDVVDEVGRDPVRFMMLYRKNDAGLDFDLAKVVEQSKDNPVFYVQYAHARTHSVFRNAAETFHDLTDDSHDVANADVSRLVEPSEIALIKQLALFPRLIEGAARAREPHRVAFYLYDLASVFHSTWTRGADSPQLRFIQADDRTLTAARLSLVLACRQVLTTGLSILGVQAPVEMARLAIL